MKDPRGYTIKYQTQFTLSTYSDMVDSYLTTFTTCFHYSLFLCAHTTQNSM